MKIDLINYGFQHSNLFRHMPLFDEINYVGHDEDKVRHYKTVREGQTCDLLALNFIRQDEKILWDAVEDFVKRSTLTATGGVRGVYIFDLLTMDIHREIKTFKHAELATVIMKTAGTLAPGQIKMIKYSSVYALLQKTIAEDWGKIVFKTAVDVFKDKPEFVDLLIKRLLKDYAFAHDPVVLLLNDLSQNPIFDQRNQLQQARIKKVIAALIPDSVEFIPEVYIQDKHGARELLSGSTLQ
ncbi:MAG TPA: hypothetical protein PLF03_07390 [Candidatus Omnitrophota bacterium]|nr:hypothetical protein [Candidatus Omnitrophota bacterium]